MAKVKICGLTRPEDVLAVNHCLPEYAGFVFAPGRRQVAPETARRMIARLDCGVLPVGVFVDAPAETVAGIARQCALGAVQLHGGEDNGYIKALRGLLPPGTAVFKAIGVKGAPSLRLAGHIACDLLVLDSFHETLAGGAGKPFDWRLLQGFALPYLLAGGLHAGNVNEAVGQLNPFGVDVSSGVESGGQKDGAKIERFIQLARRKST